MMQSCIADAKAGNFKTYARWLGVIDVILMMAVPILCVVTNNLLPIITMVLMIIFSVLAGIIELPLCCTCFQCCRAIGDKMIYFKHFLMRALMYATFAASLIAVQVVQENNSAGWVLGILNGINAILYVIAHCTGETPGDEAAEEGVARDRAREAVREQALKAAGGVAKDPKVQEAALNAAKDPAVQKQAIDVAKANPDFAAKALKAAARV